MNPDTYPDQSGQKRLVLPDTTDPLKSIRTRGPKGPPLCPDTLKVGVCSVSGNAKLSGYGKERSYPQKCNSCGAAVDNMGMFRQASGEGCADAGGAGTIRREADLTGERFPLTQIIALRILENIRAGRIYDESTAAWAKRVVQAR